MTSVKSLSGSRSFNASVLDSEEIVPGGMVSLEDALLRSYNIEVIDAPIVDISSTEIRDGLLAGEDMSEFLM